MGDKISSASGIDSINLREAASRLDSAADEGNPKIQFAKKPSHFGSFGNKLRKFFNRNNSSANVVLKKFSKNNHDYNKKEFLQAFKNLKKSYNEDEILKCMKSDDFELLNENPKLKKMSFSETLNEIYRVYPTSEEASGVYLAAVQQLESRNELKGFDQS